MEKTKRKYCSEQGAPRGKLYATNWLEGITDSHDYGMVEVSFKNTRVGFYSNPHKLPLKIGDIVTVEGNPGHDVGRVTMVGRLVRLQMRKNGVKEDAELKPVFRLATQADMEKFEESRSKEHSTMIRSRKIAEDLQLNMKIGDVEYQGDGGKAIFYYIADERVDFRKLIRILAETFKVRIEMKQIGARQEAGRIGGIGPCGRPLCCASWMTHFVSVGTGAARIQDLSMNPQKLAGQCGKLKCCLNFETDIYSEAQKKLPSKDTVLQTVDAEYFLFKSDILAGKLTYSTDKKIPANLVTIDLDRVNEIISLNNKGLKVESLLPEAENKARQQSAPVDLVEQESLTRFDKSKKNKKKKKNNPGQKPDKAPQDKAPQAEQPPVDKGKPNRPKPHHEDKPRDEHKKQTVNKEMLKPEPVQSDQQRRRRRGSPKRQNNKASE